MKKENSKSEGLSKLIKGNKNRIKKASFNLKNRFYLFVLYYFSLQIIYISFFLYIINFLYTIFTDTFIIE